MRVDVPARNPPPGDPPSAFGADGESQLLVLVEKLDQGSGESRKLIRDFAERDWESFRKGAVAVLKDSANAAGPGASYLIKLAFAALARIAAKARQGSGNGGRAPTANQESTATQ